MSSEEKAARCYRIISRTANDTAVVQAGANLASLLTGGLPVIHLAIDGMCLTFQAALWNEVAEINGKPSLTKEAVWGYIKPNLLFILGNLALDKGLSLFAPVVGLPFCFAFARALTWRLGAFFTAIAALDATAPSDLLLEKLAQLVAELFPRGDFFFTLADPPKQKFVDFIVSLEGLNVTQAETRINAALRVLQGEVEIAEEDDPSGHDDEDTPDETAVVAPNYPVVPWRGGAAANFVVEESVEPGNDPVWRELPLLPWHCQTFPDTATHVTGDGGDDETIIIVVEPDAVTQQPMLLTITADSAMPATPPTKPKATAPKASRKDGKRKVVAKKKATSKASAQK